MSFPTSYIKTEGSQVTRAADNVFRSGQQEYSRKEGTFLIAVHALGYGSGAIRLISIDDDLHSSNQYMQLMLLANGTLAGSVSPSYRPTGFNSELRGLGLKGMFAISYNQSTLTISGSGLSKSTDVLPGFLNDANFIRFFRQRIFGGVNYSGIIKGVRYIPLALSPEELEALTAPEAN